MDNCPKVCETIPNRRVNNEKNHREGRKGRTSMKLYRLSNDIIVYRQNGWKKESKIVLKEGWYMKHDGKYIGYCSLDRLQAEIDRYHSEDEIILKPYIPTIDLDRVKSEAYETKRGWREVT
jgi:hypothetical protein